MSIILLLFLWVILFFYKTEDKLLLRRKLYRHIAILFPIFYLILGFWWACVFLLFLLCFSFILYLLGDKIKKFSSVVYETELLIAKKDKPLMKGTFNFLLSLFISLLLFPKDIFVLASFCSIIYDSFSAVCGSKWHIIRITKTVSLGGLLFGFLMTTGTVLNLVVYEVVNLPLSVALVMPFLCVLLEFLPVDDNLTQVPVCCFVVWVLLA